MKRKISWLPAASLATMLCVSVSIRSAESQGLGQFEEHGDIGTVLHPGAASFDPGTGTYTLTGSGENMWASADAFHFLWKKVSGDFSLTADIAFPTATGNPHKKAVLMIRQSLDADSAYVDAALHVAGLTSLQSREEKGGATHEVGIDGEPAVQLRLEKRGSYFYMYLARKGEKLHLGGGSMRLELKEPFYIGLGVCAHDKDAVETATFSNVSISAPAKGKLKLYSTLETISLSSTDQRVVAVYKERADAPTWTADGTSLVFRKGKSSAQIPATGGKEEPSTAAPNKTNSRAKPSPDGQREATLSYSGKKPMEATLNIRTIGDGRTKVLAKLLAGQGTLSDAPWSPDGKRLTFVSYQLLP